MTAPPLTHHDILRLVEPFSRGGRQVDLAASDRVARRLVFKPVALGGPASPGTASEFRAPVAPNASAAASATAKLPASAAAAPSGLQELLTLDDLGTGSFLLTRTLSLPSGLQASAQAMGPEPGALNEALALMPPERQFSLGPGFEIARSYRLQWRGPASGSPPGWALSSGVVRLERLTLTMTVSGVKGVPAEIALQSTLPNTAANATPSAPPPAPAGQIGLPAPHPAGPLDLPQDLLAVLGWNWARLLPGPRLGGHAPYAQSWKTLLRLPGPTAGRTAKAETALAQAAAHLALTFAEPPERYHERHLGARWAVFFRRGIPLLNVAFLLLTLWLMPHFEVGNSPGLGLLLYHVPTLLIAGSFWLQELPAFEIPPWPRRLRPALWQG